MLYTFLLILHIMAGAIALVSGGIAFTVRKGKGWHAKAGTFFYYGMLAVGFSALIMCLLRSNPFLFVVGLFSLYMTISGYRSIRLFSSRKVDWLVWIFTLTGTILFLFRNFQASATGLTPVLYVFSFILLGMLWLDFREFRLAKGAKKKNLRKHISRMGGAYIATITAFLVTNLETEPAFILWLLPTVAITPVLIYFQYKYSGRSKSRTAG